MKTTGYAKAEKAIARQRNRKRLQDSLTYLNRKRKMHSDQRILIRSARTATAITKRFENHDEKHSTQKENRAKQIVNTMEKKAKRQKVKWIHSSTERKHALTCPRTVSHNSRRSLEHQLPTPTAKTCPTTDKGKCESNSLKEPAQHCRHASNTMRLQRWGVSPRQQLQLQRKT